MIDERLRALEGPGWREDVEVFVGVRANDLGPCWIVGERHFVVDRSDAFGEVVVEKRPGWTRAIGRDGVVLGRWPTIDPETQ